MADDDLKALAKRLKAAGEKGLTRELNKGIRDAVLPLRTEAPKSALRVLPGRGGLAQRVASSKISIGKRENGIRFTMRNQYQLEKMDKPGELRRPVFPRRTRIQKITRRNKGSAKLNANRKKWAWETQKIKPGWFSIPANKVGEQVGRDVEAAVQNVARQIEGK